jgi:hypothetical protein
MSLTKALVWWNRKGGIHDHDDTMFVAGYQKAIDDAAKWADKLLDGGDYARTVRRMDDLPMDFGN